jgi:hypothetical protein
MWQTVLGVTVASVLTLIGALHVNWAFNPWPFRSARGFVDNVLGGGEDMAVPPWPATVAVGVLLLAAGYLTLTAAGVAPTVLAPDWLYRIGAGVVALVLLARGFAGPLLNRGAVPQFVRWNLVLYSPLCVVLGAAVALLVITMSRRA